MFADFICDCGSDLEADKLFDARGIYCCRYCPKCEKKKKNSYKQDVLTNPNYECDEQIEEDY
jgi:hypothetical protein